MLARIEKSMELQYSTPTGTIRATRDTHDDRPGLWTVTRGRHTVYLTDEQFASTMAFAIAAVDFNELPDYDVVAAIPGIKDLNLLP